jgi:hypothetical protein
LAFGCWLFGSLASTFAVLWTQQRCSQLLSHSLLFEPHDGEAYAIVGTLAPNAGSEPIPAAPAAELSPAGKHGFLSEGRVFLTWKLQASAFTGGALRMPEPFNTFAEGDYRLKTAVNSELGVLHIRQRACWDVRLLLLTLGGEVGDTLLITLNFRDRTAMASLGDEEMLAQLTSGLSEPTKRESEDPPSQKITVDGSPVDQDIPQAPS